ncbi:MAG: AraC family transcriptional regulator [Desulfobacteraceae bacterium]|nr:AraC family transcriptional regulator [Desulfobacteraceae bacterium]
MTYQRTHTVSIGMVRILKSYAQSVGVDFNRASRALAFDTGLLADDAARISAHLFDALWQAIIISSKDQTPGLNFGQQMTHLYPGGSILFTMMINCSTIGDALKIFTRYHKIMADVIQPIVKTDKDLTILSWETPDLLVQNHTTLSEALICAFQMILTHLSQGAIVPVRVSFAHKQPKNILEYNNFFKCPVSFGSTQNDLVIRTSNLDINIHLANKELFKILETHAIKLSNTIDKNKLWSNKVVKQINDTLISGKRADIALAAYDLALGKRTLQEKLKSEKTCFRDLLESVRKQIAIENLSADKLAICDIAFLLGYSDQSAFNHAFKRWTGKTPKVYIHELE